MKLPTNSFTSSIAEKVQQVGLWVSLGSNFSAEAIAPAGYDWVFGRHHCHCQTSME